MRYATRAADPSRNRQANSAAMISHDNVVRTVALVLLLTVGLLISSCNRQHSSNRIDPTPATPAQKGGGSELSGQEALQLVKDLIDRDGYRVSVSVSYQDYENREVPCSPTEVESNRSAYPHNPELWPCKSPDGAPPYMKRVYISVDKCCRTESVLIHSRDILWESPAPATDDKWNIGGNFSVKGQQHSANWLVDRKSKTVGTPVEK